MEELVENQNGYIELSNGEHTLSGVGSTTTYDEFCGEDIDIELFCIDGVTFGAYIDPNNGWRSYGCFSKVNEECEVKFPPQRVIIENVDIKAQIDDEDPYAWCGFEENRHLIRVLDAETKKIVLEIGTDYTDDYYPMAIHNYIPENLAINQNR